MDRIENWCEWLNAQLKEQHMNRAQLHRQTGVGRSTIYGWMYRDSSPTLNSAAKVIAALGYKLIIGSQDDLNDFASWLKQRMIVKKFCMASLSRRSGISEAAIKRYLLGEVYPTLMFCEFLCDALGEPFGIVKVAK